MNIFSHFFAEGCKPIPFLTVSQWCDLYAKLPPSVSEPGKFRVDRTPYMREILDAMTPNNGINYVSLMLAAQLAKTEALNQLQAYLMHYNPNSYIVYQPTVEISDTYVKTKINPMIDTNEILKEIFDTKNTNNLSEKNFKGCLGIYKGATSASSFRMYSVPIAIGDEIDAWPRDVEGEGSPLKLKENRTTTFGLKGKNIDTSTPTIKDFSNIEDLFLEGDQRYYHVPCPHCQAKQVLKFSNLKYTKNPSNELNVLPDSIYYECEVCKAEIRENDKTWMLFNGIWIPANPSAPSNRRSYQLSGMYSPLGWLSWEKMCNEWLQAQKDTEKLKTFVNTRLGETFFENSEQPSYAKIKALIEPTERDYVNEKVVSLWAGIDTQNDRFAVIVIGFGKDQEQWVISYDELIGNTAEEQAWQDLKDYVERPFKHASGVELFVSGAAIDTQGQRVEQAYAFVRKNQHKFYGIKGASTNIGSFMRQGEEVDKDLKTGQKYSNPLRLFLVNTLLGKKTIYGFLNNQLTNDKKEGAGVIHFPSHLPDAFFPMLTAERLVRKQDNGTIKEKFIIPKGTRNEALDCYNYAYCLAYTIGKVQNLYSSNYDKFWEAVIGKKIKKEENKNNPEQNKPTQRPNKSSWLGNSRNGFSIR